MKYDKDHRSAISFPLGGIGTGCIGLAGSGHLVDWEIANHPNKCSTNRYSHFAIKAEADGTLLDARILNGDLPPPYMGNTTPAEVKFGGHRGFGYGAASNLLPGLPHFRDVEFDGTFPVATLEFSEPGFPGKVKLTAFNPLIPLNSFDSSLPGALFEFTVRNDSARTVTYTLAGSLSSMLGPSRSEWKRDGEFPHLEQTATSVPADSADYGELTLAAGGGDSSSGQSCWYRGAWVDDLNTFWNDFTRPGEFAERNYRDASRFTNGHATSPVNGDTGTLALRFEVAPGESRSVVFALAWYYPNRRNDWNPGDREYPGWRNWYATQFDGAAQVADYLLENYSRLKAETFRFRDALFDSTLPPEVLDAVSANLSTLKSPTCMRLENGEFYAFEGCQSMAGSCEGSCTHVWNYAYALPYLFPDLERSMRELDFTYNFQPEGGLGFRLQLPVGRPPTPFRPCVDGQMGGVLKTFREWKISGDTEWLRRWYPGVKRSIEYAWSPRNYDRWDPDQSGVLTGRQHHTLDVELFGVNSWLTGFYLAALKAGALMADAVGETADAELFRTIFERGRKRIESELFNGEYYSQKVDLTDRSILEAYDEDTARFYWNDETGEIKYQIGDGCLIDQVLAQWHADLIGLGDIFEPERVVSALRAIHRHNFKPSLRNYANFWRVFGLNDEAGTVICTWPRRERPAIPVPYATETMHGFEYQAACHLILRGFVEEGLEMVRAVRDRYDGHKRNPWNEIECGSNYARSMASYALLAAFSGFRSDLPDGTVRFAPLPFPGNEFRCFWSTGPAWGVYRRSAERDELEVLSGTLRLRRFELDRADRVISAALDGKAIGWKPEKGAIRFNTEIEIAPGAPLVIKSKA